MQTKTFNPVSLEDIMVFFNGNPDDWKYATAAAWAGVATLPTIVRQTLDTTNSIRKFAPGLKWRRTAQWSRSPHLIPVGGLAQPHAKPAQQVRMVGAYMEPDPVEFRRNFTATTDAIRDEGKRWRRAGLSHYIRTFGQSFGAFYGVPWERI